MMAKITIMEMIYCDLIAKIKFSGRSSCDEDLYGYHEYNQEIHDIEKGKARHYPPAVLSSGKDGVDDENRYWFS